MKCSATLLRKGFPLILMYLIVSILCCLTVPILHYLTVPMVAGQSTSVTIKVANMTSYVDGTGTGLIVDVYINVSEPTTIISWEINVKVNPEVLGIGYNFTGGFYYTASAQDTGYFLYDWAYPGNITSFDRGIPDNETGTLTAIAQSVSGWRNFDQGVGADTDGLWEKLVRLYFTQLNTTTAYSPIVLTQALYGTTNNAPGDDIHEANVINGHFGTPIHDVATTSVSTSPSVSATRGTVIQFGVETFNLGGYNETFTVTFSYNKTATEWEFIGNYTFTLTPLESDTKSFLDPPFWDTESVELGNHTFKAVHNLTDANLDNDIATTTIEITRPEWDVAVTAVSAHSEATAGGSVNINVTVANEGTKPITNVTVTLYYDGTIEEQNFTEPDVLVYGETIDLAFEWDTTGVTPGNYTIEAGASLPPMLNTTPVSERVEYNNFESTEVEIKIPDLNGNGVVDAFDLFLLSKAYGTSPTSLQQIDLYVNADDGTRADGWTRVGDNPYLDYIDYPMHYVHATGSGDYVGDFGFEDSGKCIEPISNVTVQLYAQQSGKSHYLEVFVWDGSSWTSLGEQLTPNGYFGWMTWTATTVLNTWAKIDGAKIYIVTKDSGTYEVDCGRLQVDYVMHEPADLDYDWDVDLNDLDLFLENYGKST